MATSIRTTFLVAALAYCGAVSVQAQPKTFYVAGYGGTFEAMSHS